MAGSLPGLALTQRNYLDGKPLIGGKLFIYQANTTTPVTVYKDFNLTTGQEHPFPISLDAWGQIPQFYMPDGAYRARLTDSTEETILFDVLQVQAIGEAGGEGTPPTVDSTTIYQTGDIKIRHGTGTLAGFVRLNGRTIGSATSGASERANSDVQVLYTYGWGLGWEVVGGRGANAAADWAANKPLVLPDWAGCALGFLDDLGNGPAGRLTEAVFGTDPTVLGAIGGSEGATISQAQLPAIKPELTATAEPHAHGYDDIFADTNDPTNGIGAVEDAGGAPNTWTHHHAKTTDPTTVSVSVEFTNNLGSGDEHANVQPTVLVTAYIKL